MTNQDVINYWLSSAAEDYDTAQALFSLKRCHHSLFFCHLAIEKLLKGLVYLKTETHALPIHDLVKLAQFGNLTLTDLQKNQLAEITTWNIKARYESIKREFYNKATEIFTRKWFTIVEELYLWLKKQY